MNVLITELKKEIYNGLTASEALVLLPIQVTKIGRIQEYNKLDLITLVITNDITERLANAMTRTDEQLSMTETPELAAQYRGLAKIMGKALDIDLIKADIYRINLGLPNIRAMFDGALAFGLLTTDEHTAMLKLAEYKEGVDFSIYELSDVEQAQADLLLEGEHEVLLPNSTQAKVYTLTITKNTPKNTAVQIMQRFGADVNDLTPWHPVGQFSNVQYKQQSYKSQIGACAAAYRELKAVSEYLLDMSVV